MRAGQANKIRELRQALIDAGFVSLDQQATALGLPRSTTWAVLKGQSQMFGSSRRADRPYVARPQAAAGGKKDTGGLCR